MPIYHIEKPQQTSFESNFPIIIRVLFPPMLLWDALKYIANKIAGSYVASFFWAHPTRQTTNRKSGFFENMGLTLQKNTLITHDLAELDTLEIRHHRQNPTHISKHNYILYFPDNYETYESVSAEMIADALALENNVVGFNYRGVGKSTGHVHCANDLITDGIAQVQHLLNKGVQSHHITLKGHGFGGAIATMVAQHFHTLNHPVYLFNDRSFSSLTRWVVAMIYPYKSSSGLPDSLKEQAIDWVITALVKFTLSLTKWEINADLAFDNIPEKYKEYIVVRTRSTLRVKKNAVDNQTIPHSASLHMAFKDSRQRTKKLLSQLNTTMNAQEMFVTKSIMLDPLIARKMESIDPKANGHLVQLSALKNRNSETAEQFFNAFVSKNQQKPPTKQSKANRC